MAFFILWQVFCETNYLKAPSLLDRACNGLYKRVGVVVAGAGYGDTGAVRITTSTLRFCLRPASFILEAIGRDSP